MAVGIRSIGALALLLAAGCATAPTPSAPPIAQADKFRKCAETFEAVYAEHRDHKNADTLLWNAADCRAAAGDRTRAIMTYELLVARFPESDHVERARERLDRLDPPEPWEPRD